MTDVCTQCIQKLQISYPREALQLIPRNLALAVSKVGFNTLTWSVPLTNFTTVNVEQTLKTLNPLPGELIILLFSVVQHLQRALNTDRDALTAGLVHSDGALQPGWTLQTTPPPDLLLTAGPSRQNPQHIVIVRSIHVVPELDTDLRHR